MATRQNHGEVGNDTKKKKKKEGRYHMVTLGFPGREMEEEKKPTYNKKTPFSP